MSRYIDADEFWYSVLENVFHEATDEYWEIRQCLYETPTADVVSREQFNECYDECLRLRSENEQLMDSLRAYEDDRK